jgi:germination protein M
MVIKRGGVVLVSCLLIGMLSGCQVWDGSSDPIDPPQSMGKMKNAVTDAKVTGPKAISDVTEQTLYFKDKNGYVAPVTIQTPMSDSPAKAVLAGMVEGAAIPHGFKALLPKGTEVLGMNIVKDEKLAVVDFSKPFLSYKKEDERKVLEAVTWALTSFPTITQVQIHVEGKALTEMPASGTPMDEPLTRKMGINVEQTIGVTTSQAMPVTLYYEAKRKKEESYLVPVTRLLPRTDQPLVEAMKQLAIQPNGIGLQPVLTPDMQTESVQMQNQVIKVSLKDQLLKQAADLDETTLKAVVLSLLDSSQATHVQVMVNHEATQDKPVGRMKQVNAFGL